MWKHCETYTRSLGHATEGIRVPGGLVSRDEKGVLELTPSRCKEMSAFIFPVTVNNPASIS